MALLTHIFLLLFILLPSFSHGFTDRNQTLTQSLILKSCEKIDDQATCLTSIQSRIKSHDHLSVLASALQHTHNEARSTIDKISEFNTLTISLREQLALEDCRELLDFSISELASSVSEINRIRSGSKNHHSHENLKAWLSAALSNQDTCLEGFEGTDRRLEKFVKGSLSQVTQLINNVFTMYSQIHQPKSESKDDTRHEDFPKWMGDGDQKIIVSGLGGMHVDAVVALDGSGRYRNIGQAINEAPSHSNRRYVIYIKQGVYKENIDMKKKKSNIMIVGDGIGKTIITGNRNMKQGWTTFRTATFAVSGEGFIARDITFQNTAGPKNFQAVALRVDSDKSVIYRCSMEGYQDTLYAHSLRQFYRECSISGTIDFIFGNGAAVLQNCKIYTREPLPMQKVTITAQGRKDPKQGTGFSIQDSFVYATRPTYLGRPWKEYSRTVFIHTFMSSMVEARGWLEWTGNFALGTLWYGEYGNYGPGAGVGGRVRWPGYHVIGDASTAGFFTAGRFLDGMSWLPATGVPFTPGLSG